MNLFDKKVLITGGGGLVGRELTRILLDYCSPVSLCGREDSMFGYSDLTDEATVYRIFNKVTPDIVIHLAGKVGGVLENIKFPVDFYLDNAKMANNLCNAAYSYDVDVFVGCLSTCIYPDVATCYPMTESDIYNGKPSISNIGYSYGKRALLQLMECFELEKCHTRFHGLIPCNMYGPHDNSTHFIPQLIQKVINAEENGDSCIMLHGTGLELRQFMFVEDFARIIVDYLQMLDIDDDRTTLPLFNVAPQQLYSVDEIANRIVSLMGSSVSIQYNGATNTQLRKDVSSDLLESKMQLNFTDIDTGLKRTVNDKLNK